MTPEAQEPAVDEGPRRAAEIIAELLAGAEHVDHGEFEIDGIAAIEKMRRFRYEDRSVFLVPMVEGLYALGGESLTVSRRGQDLELVVPGVMIPNVTRNLSGLFGFALRDASTASDAAQHGLGRLAVAIDMALGLEGIERIVITLPLPGRGEESPEASVIAEYRRDVAPAISRSPHAVEAATIYVDREGTGALTRLLGVAPELEPLRTALAQSRRPASIANEHISGHGIRRRFRRKGHSDGYRFSAGLVTEELPESRVDLFSHDVCVETVRAEGIGFYAEVHLERVSFDLSQTSVVRDEVVEGALAACEKAREEVLGELAGMNRKWSADWSGSQRPEEWPERRTLVVLGRLDPRSPAAEAGVFVGKMGLFAFGLLFWGGGVVLAIFGWAALLGLTFNGEAVGESALLVVAFILIGIGSISMAAVGGLRRRLWRFVAAVVAGYAFALLLAFVAA